jgi:lipopolysaccharide/colanic/teichoic acid biosynthesis glycosyltransferase
MKESVRVLEPLGSEVAVAADDGSCAEEFFQDEVVVPESVRIPPRWTQLRLSRRMYIYCLKRGVDLIGGSCLLILAFPLITLGWLAVRLTSRGAGFFSQQRVGLDGNTINMLKLRSMYIDQDERVDMGKIREDEARGILFKMENDPRITPVGRFIRKTSIDELPQLWNVVKGEMSLVGPRPLVPHMLEPFPEVKEARCRVRPGITGLWQVSARHLNRSAIGMVEYDLDYVDRCSFFVDLWILLKTIPVTAMARGAH